LAEGGYEIIAGHRRQKASELAGFGDMPCIVREMTDDEAILAMTDDNLRHPLLGKSAETGGASSGGRAQRGSAAYH
jgi:hypothetical protein